MADSKVSALVAATAASSDDYLYLVDDPSGTPTSKKITVGNLEASLTLGNLAGTLSVAKGGTGQTTATAALNALLPSQSGNSGKVLQTDGTNATWETVSGGGGGGGYATIQEEGTPLTQRTTVNFVGAGLTATDDAGNSRTNISVDATLNALAEFNSNGLVTQTSADTFAARTITGTSNEVAVNNGDGVSGNPTISLPATIDLGGKTSLEIPNSAAPVVDADGEIAVDTTVADFSHGIMKYYGGEEMGIVALPIGEFTSPTDGHVVAYNATNDEFELVAQSGGGGGATATGYKTGDQSTTSATAVDITSMSFAIGANEVWTAEFYLGCTVSGAAGIRYAVTVPSGATIGAGVRGTNAIPAIITASGSLTTAVFTNTPSMTQISMLVQNGAAPGTVQVQFASGDGTVSAVAKGGQCYFNARQIA